MRKGSFNPSTSLWVKLDFALKNDPLIKHTETLAFQG